MIKETISYATLADKVGGMVLFNNHDSVDECWHEGIIKQPLMEEKLDELEKESEQWALDRIAESTDEVEKAKLMEEFESDKENGEFSHDLYDSEIYQTFAITPEGARLLFNHTDQLISYSETLDLFFWHISHWGTGWTHVFTTFTDWETAEETPEWYTYDSSDVTKYTIG